MKRFVHLSAVGANKRITLASYVAAVRYAKAHPDAEFKHGFSSWWSVSGAELLREFHDGMIERINSGIPRSAPWGGEAMSVYVDDMRAPFGKRALAVKLGAIETDRFGPSEHRARITGNTKLLDAIAISRGLRSA